MRRGPFTKDEITLCTYGARFDGRDIGGIEAICSIRGRSKASIELKIRNIASMLDEEGISRESDVHALTGRPTGESGRRTNWEWVKPLTSLPRSELLERCRAILDAHQREA